MAADTLAPGGAQVPLRDSVLFSAVSPASEWSWGIAIVSAQSHSDPSRTLTSHVLVIGRGSRFPGANIDVVRSVPSAVPTDLDALLGTIDVQVHLYSAVYPVERTATSSGPVVTGNSMPVGIRNP